MEIPELKSQVNILTVAKELGIVIKQNKACCPFHEDKTPSLQFSQERQIATCFSGKCKAGTMDVIELVEKKLNLNTHDSINWLKNFIPAETIKQPRTKKIMETINYQNDFEQLIKTFQDSKTAKQYILDRHLKAETIEIAYNPYQKARVGYLKGCVVFPLKNQQGQIVSLYGRSIRNQDKAKHYYTKDRKGLYPGYPNPQTKCLILTESIIDTVTLQQHLSCLTDQSFLSLFGTNGLTAEHTKAIQELPHLEEIILFLDGDQAGKQANEKHGDYLKQVFPKVTISIVDTPIEEDINSLLDGHNATIYEELINKRKPFSFQLKKEVPATPETALNTQNKEYITFQQTNLKATLLGGISLTQIDRLRATILIERVPKLSPLHSIRQSGLDLYNDTFVDKFIRSTAEKLELGTSDIRIFIAELTDKLEQYRQLEQSKKQEIKPTKRILSQQEKQEALAYLKAPKLLERTGEDIGKTGVIGEEDNRLIMYLGLTSRLRKTPLHIISLGASGTGKTYLQEKIAELMPQQDIIEITALSDNAFYYFSKNELMHKIVLVEDMDGLAGTGANTALLALRELMSKKRISKRVVMKDTKGNMNTISLLVEGPICVAGTTTKERVYEDNANRSLLLYRDNSKAHQQAIMGYQRKLSAGNINKKEEQLIKERFKNIQSLLQPIEVINPYAEELNIPSEVFKPLRSNAHYLQFIECVTFYHQYQRPIKKNSVSGLDYIETTIEDIAWANKLLKEVLLAKADELTGACRTFFEVLKAHLIKTNKRSFYTKEVRTELRMNPSNLKHYTQQLLTYGLIKIVGGNRYKNGYEYEVINNQEYKELQANIVTALDKALLKLKK